MVRTKLIEKWKVLKQKMISINDRTKLNTNDRTGENNRKKSSSEGKSIPNKQKKVTVKVQRQLFLSFHLFNGTDQK